MCFVCRVCQIEKTWGQNVDEGEFNSHKYFKNPTG